MAQFLRPDSNITQTSFTGGFAEIDESTSSDADFAYGANNTAAVLEVSLSNPTGTPDVGTRTIRYRVAKTNAGVVDGAGNAVTVTAALYQGTTLISTDTAKTATGTWTGYSWNPDTSSVTDWNDLRLRFTTSASGGSPAARRGGAVSWGEMETPDAASSFSQDPGIGSDTNTALNLSTILGLGLNSETNTSLNPSISLGIAFASTTNTAFALEVGGIAFDQDPGIAADLNTAFNLPVTLSVGRSEETSYSFNLGTTLGLGRADSTDTAFALEPPQPVVIEIGLARTRDRAMALRRLDTQRTSFRFAIGHPFLYDRSSISRSSTSRPN